MGRLLQTVTIMRRPEKAPGWPGAMGGQAKCTKQVKPLPLA